MAEGSCHKMPTFTSLVDSNYWPNLEQEYGVTCHALCAILATQTRRWNTEDLPTIPAASFSSFTPEYTFDGKDQQRALPRGRHVRHLGAIELASWVVESHHWPPPALSE